MKFTHQLESMNACPDAIKWVNGRSLRKSWQVAGRADWMLWLAAKCVDRKTLVLAACDCAETALKYVPKDEDRPRLAIETARKWCAGTASTTDVRAAAADAYAGAYAGAAYAAYAADAYAGAYAGAAYAADAAGAAAGGAAAYAAAAAGAAYAAGDAAAAADAATHKKMCSLVRKRIPVEMIEEGLK